jgi:hypothetical protein
MMQQGLHFKILFVLSGWGAYNVWSRRRTVLDLIVLVYYEPFKAELLRRLDVAAA